MTNGSRRGRGINITLRPIFNHVKDPVPIAQEAGWVAGPVWTDAENLSPTGIRCPDRPTRSQSLYLLRYQLLPKQDENSKIRDERVDNVISLRILYYKINGLQRA
jgi:hypothetical protein